MNTITLFQMAKDLTMIMKQDPHTRCCVVSIYLTKFNRFLTYSHIVTLFIVCLIFHVINFNFKRIRVEEMKFEARGTDKTKRVLISVGIRIRKSSLVAFSSTYL